MSSKRSIAFVSTPASRSTSFASRGLWTLHNTFAVSVFTVMGLLNPPGNEVSTSPFAMGWPFVNAMRILSFCSRVSPGHAFAEMRWSAVSFSSQSSSLRAQQPGFFTYPSLATGSDTARADRDHSRLPLRAVMQQCQIEIVLGDLAEATEAPELAGPSQPRPVLVA